MKKLSEKMRLAGLDPKKEWATAVLILLLALGAGALSYLYFRRFFLFPIFLFLAALLEYFHLTRYQKAEKLRMAKATDEFVEAFTYFSIYVGNGANVYHALEKTSALSKENVRPLFQELLSEIDADKSLLPYLHFASHFSSLSVKEVMLSVYQMVEQGGGEENLRRFQTLFGRFSEERHRLNKAKQIETLGNFSSLPLIGSGITMLMLTAALVEIMGGFYHVL